MTPPVMFIVGCTGCGKGALAQEIAQRIGAEIVSLDSMKIYRRMDTGTAKPSPEICRAIPHHLLDVVEPSEDFSVAQYVQQAEAAIADIQSRDKPVLFVGGTPLYLKALTEGLFEGPGADPKLRAKLHTQAELELPAALHRQLEQIDPQTATRIHPNDLRRIVRAIEVYELTGIPISHLQTQWDKQRKKFDYTLIGLRREREDQNHRTNERVRRMIDQGLVDEVNNLLVEPVPLSATARKALGYAEIIRHLRGELPLADAVELIKINTRRLAKAQRTWFKRFGETKWIDLKPESNISNIADKLLKE